MSTIHEIPLVALPQSFTISLGNNAYQLVFKWNEKAACWMVDIIDSNGDAVLMGSAIVTGADLFKQFEYLGFGGELIVQTDHNTDAVPTFTNLGSTGHVYFITP